MTVDAPRDAAWNKFYSLEPAMRPPSRAYVARLMLSMETVTMAQLLFSKAAIVDYSTLAAAQNSCDLVRAEGLLQDAFATDVRPAIQQWRDSKGLPEDPIVAFRESGYLERITKERAARNSRSVTSYA